MFPIVRRRTQIGRTVNQSTVSSLEGPGALRIALVAPYDLSTPGGVNTQIRQQAAALSRRGHDVHVFGPASAPLDNGERDLGRTLTVTFSGTESRLGVDPRAVAAVARMRRDQYDIVHVHEPLTPIVPWIVVLGSKAPVVGTFHVYREDGHRFYAAFGWVLGPIIRQLRARIAVSPAARRTLEPYFPGACDLVPNGISVERFRDSRPRPAAFDAGRLHVLYVGRLENRKGVEHLIRAMARVRRDVPTATLVIVGEGRERERLSALAREMDIAARFEGRVRDDDLPAYFQAADVVCSPALGGESFGIVLLEAMAAGVPIVASRIEGYDALVGASGAAALVPPADAEALAAVLSDLLRSPERRHEMGARGADAARAYDWTSIAERLEAIYRRALAAPRAAPN